MLQLFYALEISSDAALPKQQDDLASARLDVENRSTEIIPYD
jgi:hypothetical protein